MGLLEKYWYSNTQDTNYKDLVVCKLIENVTQITITRTMQLHMYKMPYFMA